MFLVNSRLGQFSAAASGSICLYFTLTRRPFSRSYGAILPSSLTRVFPRALGFSPHLPVSVCGTGTLLLTRGFSWQFGVSSFANIFAPLHLLALSGIRLFLVTPPTGLDALFHPCAMPTLLRHPFAPCVTRWSRNFNRLSIAYAFRPRLRSRLTLSGRAFLRKP